ncbi:hypothetical protein [Dysgonomonas sp. 25]|uniref:hypothetical protein n=1 Tax=Dysgonomonas sp. 25 TaxID=2302933 RepID=UPI0013D43504|nr:hypothetical protein [Dysgonomonas sp. 25]
MKIKIAVFITFVLVIAVACKKENRIIEKDKCISGYIFIEYAGESDYYERPIFIVPEGDTTYFDDLHKLSVTKEFFLKKGTRTLLKHAVAYEVSDTLFSIFRNYLLSIEEDTVHTFYKNDFRLVISTKCDTLRRYASPHDIFSRTLIDSIKYDKKNEIVFYFKDMRRKYVERAFYKGYNFDY